MAAEGTLVSHLIELRRRLVRCVIAVVGLFLLMVGFAGDIYATMATPLMNMLPEQGSMIATEIAAPFLTPFKLTFYLSFFLAIPYLLSQAWLFIAPGLYQQEKKLALPVIVISITLFYAGAAFALFVVSPLLYSFFNSVAPAGVIIMPDISRFLDFILKLAFGFGLAFEIPVITFVVVKTGLVNVQTLRDKRPYIIIAVFVIAMLLTPPDVISQLLLAVPALLLFEIALVIADYGVSSGVETKASSE